MTSTDIDLSLTASPHEESVHTATLAHAVAEFRRVAGEHAGLQLCTVYGLAVEAVVQLCSASELRAAQLTLELESERREVARMRQLLADHGLR